MSIWNNVILEGDKDWTLGKGCMCLEYKLDN